jgi:hypothetical protein
VITGAVEMDGELTGPVGAPSREIPGMLGT